MIREPHKKTLGLVPYDFRAPTLAHIRCTFQNAREDHLWRAGKKRRGR